jgi:hypothetical protein
LAAADTQCRTIGIEFDQLFKLSQTVLCWDGNQYEHLSRMNLFFQNPANMGLMMKIYNDAWERCGLIFSFE